MKFKVGDEVLVVNNPKPFCKTVCEDCPYKTNSIIKIIKENEDLETYTVTVPGASDCLKMNIFCLKLVKKLTQSQRLLRR